MIKVIAWGYNFDKVIHAGTILDALLIRAYFAKRGIETAILKDNYIVSTLEIYNALVNSRQA